MTTAVFLFHPRPEASRINARLAEAARGNQDVVVRDVYSLYADFRIDVATEQAALTEADRIVLQFPMYWYSSPALLKQWEDDVLTYGWAYGSTGTALHGKELGLAVSLGAPATSYSHNGAAHYTPTELLRPFQATAALIGTRFLTPFLTPGAMSLGRQELEARAEAYGSWLTSPAQELGTFE